MPGIVIVIIVVVAVMVAFLLRRGNANDVETTFSPSSAPSSDFHLTVEDTFSIKGRGLVVVGKVESGTIAVGQRIQISSADGTEHYETTVKGLEAFHRQITTAQTGDNIGILLADLAKDHVKRGMIITAIL